MQAGRVRYLVPEAARPLLEAARAWQHLTGRASGYQRLLRHADFHHHNQLCDITRLLGIQVPIARLDGDPVHKPAGTAGPRAAQRDTQR
jgi:hypothetical protein